MSITGTGISAAGGLRTVSMTIRSQPHDRDLVLFAPIYDKINNRIDARRIISKSSSVSSGVYQVILGDTFTSIAIDDTYTLTVVSGSATQISATDAIVTGDCVLSTSPVANYKTKLARVTERMSGGAHPNFNITKDELYGVTQIGTNAFTNCYNLTSIALPSTVTEIGLNAFQWCTNLTSITIPENVWRLRSYAFNQCSKLTSIIFAGTALTTLEKSAINNNAALSSITLPSSVTDMGADALAYNSSLAEVTCFATTPPTAGANILRNTHADLVIYVPAESVEAYKTATNWSTYASRIQAIPNS